MFLLNFIAGFG